MVCTSKTQTPPPTPTPAPVRDSAPNMMIALKRDGMFLDDAKSQIARQAGRVWGFWAGWVGGGGGGGRAARPNYRKAKISGSK